MHDRKGERKIVEVEIKDTMYNTMLEIYVGFESVQQKHLDKTELHQQVMNFVKEAKFPENGQLLDTAMEDLKNSKFNLHVAIAQKCT